MSNSLSTIVANTASQRLAPSQRLTPARMLSIALLEKSLPALRAEIAAEMASNPAIEEMDHPLETSLSEAERAAAREERQDEPDYPADDFEPGRSADDDAAERRQAFFDNQVKEETLQEHLLAQLPFSEIPRADWPLVEVLVGDLDDSGFYRGSSVDAQMAFGKTADGLDAVFARILELDPPGCGARTVRECLLAQMDALAGNPFAATARKIVDRHLDDLAAGRTASVRSALGISEAEFAGALAAIRTLSARPGAAYPSERDRVEYVNPEVHAVCRDGHWFAETDVRSLPEIRISSRFESMLKDPAQTPEVRAYVRERIARAQNLREAIVQRQRTVQSIAQMAFDRQQDFFVRGFAALKPLTETEVAKALGVDVATVSRTVRDKYAETPFGTVELRRFFVSGVKTADGGAVAQDAVLGALRAIVEDEDPSAPLSDEKIASALKARNYPVARRTVAKYRGLLGIPGAAERKGETR